MTIEEIYRELIKPLAAADRYRLAQLILNGIEADDVDFSYEWSDEDLKDFTAASFRYVRHSQRSSE